MKWNSVWRISLVLSILLNCSAIAVVGSRMNQANSAKSLVTKQDPPPPTRLVEIRMLKSIPPAAPKTLKLQKTPAAPKANAPQKGAPTKQGKPGSQTSSSTATQAELTRMSTAKGHGAETSSLKKVHVDIHQRLTKNMHVELSAPKARLVPSYSGILDLRHSKIKIVLHADPALLPKGVQKPNKLIGAKPSIEFIGGKPKSTAKCVGTVGGNTVMGGGHLKIKGAENLEISGTKFCAPGAPTFGSSGSQGGGGKPSTGAEFVSYASQAQLNKNYQTLASGPLNDGGALSRTTLEGMEPGIQGEIRPTHLPEEDHPKTLPEIPEKPSQVDEKAEKGLQPSLGALSENGSIPWGPSKKKPKNGLLADFYLGRNFTKYLFTRKTRFVDFVWDGISADKELPPYNPYSVRWSGYIKPTKTEDYTIYTASDDGVRLWIDDQLVIDNWTCHAESEDVCHLPLQAGHFYKVRLDYFEASGLRGQRIRLYWEAPGLAKEYIPEANLFFTK